MRFPIELLMACGDYNLPVELVAEDIAEAYGSLTAFMAVEHHDFGVFCEENY